jgi:hypothetical protein
MDALFHFGKTTLTPLCRSRYTANTADIAPKQTINSMALEGD